MAKGCRGHRAGAVDKKAGSRPWRLLNGVRHLNLFYKLEILELRSDMI